MTVPSARRFIPDVADGYRIVSLHFEEYESVRLCDYEQLTQQEASECMGVSRPTFTRIYASARTKIATALADGCAIQIDGGTAYIDGIWYECSCGLRFNNIRPSVCGEVRCPVCGGRKIKEINVSEITLNDMNMRKIVMPTRDGRIDDHFGHCEYYTIMTVDDSNKVVSREEMASPQGCGCKSNVASIFQEKGIELMLAGNMGMGALNKLNAHGVRVIRGCSGDIMTVLNDYLEGKLQDSGESCHHHHDDGHVCHHGE